MLLLLPFPFLHDGYLLQELLIHNLELQVLLLAATHVVVVVSIFFVCIIYEVHIQSTCTVILVHWLMLLVQ